MRTDFTWNSFVYFKLSVHVFKFLFHLLVFLMLDECTNRDVCRLCFWLFILLFMAFDLNSIPSIKNSICSSLRMNARTYINGFAPSVRCLIRWWQMNDFSCGTHKTNQHSDNNLTWQSQSATASPSEKQNTNRNCSSEGKGLPRVTFNNCSTWTNIIIFPFHENIENVLVVHHTTDNRNKNFVDVLHGLTQITFQIQP